MLHATTGDRRDLAHKAERVRCSAVRSRFMIVWGLPPRSKITVFEVTGIEIASRVEYAALLVSDCLILGARQAFTREVRWPMDDPDDPYSPENLSWNWRFGGPKWRPFTGRSGRGPRLPPPEWARSPKPSKSEREQEERADARAERLHLVGLTNAAVIIMGVALGALAVMLVVMLASHH